MFYNHFLATTPRKKAASTDSTRTAKVSSGGKSRAELKALGERNEWTVRELRMSDVQRMSSDEVLWHEVFNRENLELAFTLAENQRLNRERMPTVEAQRMWGGRATEQESEKAREAGEAFARRFPTFERTLGNAQAMVAYMEEFDLDGTKIESYVRAFRELSTEGKLTLAEAQSADEYLEQHPELKDKRVPPIIQARQQREQTTAEHFAKAANATAKGTVVNLVDFPHEQRVPPQPDKASFRMKIRSMSASEIAQRCADDPAFKSALDALD